MNLETSLQKLGLTINEVTIYIYLLRKGLCLGNEVYLDNQLDKSSAYEALSNLNKKGLVYTLGQKRNQKFGAIPAERLFEMVEEKEQELKNVKNNISDLVKNLEDYSKQNYKNKHIRIIDGPDGFRNWAFDRLTAPKGSTIREISSNVLQETFVNDHDKFIQYSAIEMPKERIKRGIHVKALLQKRDIDLYKDLRNIEKTDPKLLKEVRLLPDKFDLVCSLVTYGDNTALLRKYQGEFLGLIINDKLITSLINSMFDLIWVDCKSV